METHGFTKCAARCEATGKVVKAARCRKCPSVLVRIKDSKLSRHANDNCPFRDTSKQDDIVSVVKSSMDPRRLANEISLKISFLVLKNCLPFRHTESFVRPLFVMLVESGVFSSRDADFLKSIPLSNKTTQRNMMALAHECRDEMVNRVYNNQFSIMFDETCDINKISYMSIVIRYIHDGCIIQENLEYSEIANKTAEGVFHHLSKVLAQYSMKWADCVGGCTDGASTMIGRHTGVVKRIKDVGHPSCHFFHCFLHKESLCVQDTNCCFDSLINLCGDAVSFLMKHPLHLQEVYKAVSENNDGAKLVTLKLYSRVRWLSRGKNLFSVYSNIDSIQSLLSTRSNRFDDNDLSVRFCSYLEQHPLWKLELAYVVDIYGFLNKSINRMQGVMKVFDCMKHLLESKAIISDLLEEVKMKNLSNFKHVIVELMHLAGRIVPNSFYESIEAHLSTILQRFDDRFSDVDEYMEKYGFLRFPSGIRWSASSSLFCFSSFPSCRHFT